MDTLPMKRVSLAPSKINSTMLSQMLNNLGKNEEICLSMGTDGDIDINLRSIDSHGKRVVKKFRNDIFITPEPLPLRSLWMSSGMYDMPDNVKLARKTRDKVVNKSQKESIGKLNLIRAGIELQLMFMSKEMATKVESSAGKSYLVYSLDGRDVYTNESGKPLMFKDSGSTAFQYFPADKEN